MKSKKKTYHNKKSGRTYDYILYDDLHDGKMSPEEVRKQIIAVFQFCKRNKKLLKNMEVKR